jgi:hypothetical protein
MLLSGLAILGLAVASTLSMNNDNNQVEETTETKEIGDETYAYFMSLGYEEQKDYFESNKILSMYIDREYYPNSKDYTARGASRIAKMYNREFTNRYNIY